MVGLKVYLLFGVLTLLILKEAETKFVNSLLHLNLNQIIYNITNPTISMPTVGFVIKLHIFRFPNPFIFLTNIFFLLFCIKILSYILINRFK